jgi:putative ABC transport system ATP-binding protein
MVASWRPWRFTLDGGAAEHVHVASGQGRQRGVAAVVVTHDAQLAAWADRVVFLRDGRVTGQTTRPSGPESLLTPGEIR